MALPTVTIVYKVLAKSVLPTVLSPALAAVPIPFDVLAAQGTFVSTDVTSISGTEVDRTIVLKTAPPTPATATAQLIPGQATGSPIVGFTVTAPGAGFINPPGVIIQDPAASLASFFQGPSRGAKGLAFLKLVSAPTIVSGGTGFSGSTKIAFVGGLAPGINRQAIDNVSQLPTILTQRVSDRPAKGNCVGSVSIVSQGKKYSASSTILVLGDRAVTRQATFAPVIDAFGHVTGVIITDPGQDYINPPELVLFDPTGAGSGAVITPNMQRGRAATATLTIVAGVITAVTLVDGGDGYVAPPTVVVFDPTGAGSGANIQAGPVVGGAASVMGVGRIDVLAGGRGYTAPSITLEPFFTMQWLKAFAIGDLVTPIKAFRNLMKTAIQDRLATQVTETVS